MTPSLLDIIQAVPHCRRRRMVRNGQHGIHFTCAEAMRYLAASNEWWCEACNAPLDTGQ